MKAQYQAWLEKAKKHAGWLIVLGIVEIIAGAIAIAGPLTTGIVVTVMLGIALMMAGVARLFGAFLADSFGVGALTFLWGLVNMVAGFYLTIRPGVGLLTITLVIAMVLFFDGITRIIMSFRMKPAGGWGWMLTGGILSVLFGMMIGWEIPVSSLWMVGTFVGASLLISGITTISVAGSVRSAAGGAE